MCLSGLAQDLTSYRLSASPRTCVFDEICACTCVVSWRWTGRRCCGEYCPRRPWAEHWLFNLRWLENAHSFNHWRHTSWCRQIWKHKLCSMGDLTTPLLTGSWRVVPSESLLDSIKSRTSHPKGRISDFSSFRVTNQQSKSTVQQGIITIVGMGLEFPKSKDQKGLWKMLSEGLCAVQEVDSRDCGFSHL